MFIVRGVVRVFGLVTVPRRQIKADFEPVFPAGIDEFAHQIAPAVFPRGVRDVVLRVVTREQAESVVVFRGQDHEFKPRFLRHPHPLFAIEFGRIEDRRGFGAVAPFAVRERVHRKMDKQGQFVALPGELFGRRHRRTGGRRFGREASAHRARQRQGSCQ